ncbi:uncharacterized protein L3040_008314 [Drepanopeziza brunnea f. sp. 'multigermtubi']|uniref:uncharacterized protein n=1 Tax=Drepanopeziza brunnea f. sp. 'multigermtubi' TaxID=698441 RepID=UPI0023970B19|nr:hypothetical protein L3040_008314 [Drepanopeziza brunnea f. sp. 'multigermtubi']
MTNDGNDLQESRKVLSAAPDLLLSLAFFDTTPWHSFSPKHQPPYKRVALLREHLPSTDIINLVQDPQDILEPRHSVKIPNSLLFPEIDYSRSTALPFPNGPHGATQDAALCTCERISGV